MSREIKFRFWDGFQMIKNEDINYIDFNNKFVTINDKYHGGVKQINFDENKRLMQYVGCKDINGQEIYEGDIIRLEGVDDREIGSTWEHIGKIVYKRGAFFICYFDYYADGDEELICDAQVEFGTVIGNKFENPELLEEE